MATGLPNTIADFSTTLASGVTIGATTATLTSATDSDGIVLPTGTYGFTVDRKNSVKEYFECTLTSTALTAIKTIARGTGVGTSGFARAHRKGAEVIISDFVAIKRLDDVLTTGYPSAQTPTTDYQLATKKYVDTAAISGGSSASTTAQGFVELPTQAEVDAGTATGGTGAGLSITPSLLRAKKYHDYAADAGSTDAYAITISPAITAYATGQIFTFKANTLNTGVCTLNVSGLGAKTIKKNYDQDLITGEIVANQIVIVTYDGTNMQLGSKTVPVAPTIQTFTASGTYTKTAGISYAVVELVGAGGSGAGIAASQDRAAAGGGGGGYSRKIIASATLGATETVTIGAGGVGSSGDGAAGGTTSFGAHCSATGGGGGGPNGGAGGVGSSGNINTKGSGGGAQTSLVSNDAAAGVGGSSMLGGGAYALDGNGNSGGIAGGNYGGGGSGACQSGSSGPFNGGNGAPGVVIVTEYYA